MKLELHSLDEKISKISEKIEEKNSGFQTLKARKHMLVADYEARLTQKLDWVMQKEEMETVLGNLGSEKSDQKNSEKSEISILLQEKNHTALIMELTP